MARSASAPLALFSTVSTDQLDLYALHSLDAPEPSQPPSPWRRLPCVSRLSVGFDASSIAAADNVLYTLRLEAQLADKVLNAVHLEAHLADTPALSYLRISLGAGAHVGPRPTILAVHDNLIFLESVIRNLRICLVYDVDAQSVTMIPSNPWHQPFRSLRQQRRPSAVASSVLVARDGGGYALVSMAERTVRSDEGLDEYEVQDVLYLWRSSSPTWDLVTVTAGFPAEFKGNNVAHAYGAVVAFTCGGRAFWANLVRGVMHCSLDALLLSASNGGAELEFGFIGLPVELPRDVTSYVLREMELGANMYRTMGRVGGSAIKFVAIDGFFEMPDFHDYTVTVWTLSPADQDDDGMATNLTDRFLLSMGSLAEQDEFKKAGLPTNMAPMYPSLSREEDDVIYFMLGEYTPCCSGHKGSQAKCDGYVAVTGETAYLLRVDMRRGVLLGSARLPHGFVDISLVPPSIFDSVMISSELVCNDR